MTQDTQTHADKSVSRNVGAALGIGILLLPFLFAWFTLRKGYSKLARVLSLGWMGLLVIVVFASSNNGGPNTDQNDLSTIAENSQPQDVESDLGEAAAEPDAQADVEPFPSELLEMLVRCNVLANGMPLMKPFLYMKSTQGFTYTEEDRAQDNAILEFTKKEVLSNIEESKANGQFELSKSIAFNAQSDIQSKWKSVQNSPNSIESIKLATELIDYYTINCLRFAEQ